MRSLTSFGTVFFHSARKGTGSIFPEVHPEKSPPLTLDGRGRYFFEGAGAGAEGTLAGARPGLTSRADRIASAESGVDGVKTSIPHTYPRLLYSMSTREPGRMSTTPGMPRLSLMNTLDTA